MVSVPVPFFGFLFSFPILKKLRALTSSVAVLAVVLPGPVRGARSDRVAAGGRVGV